MATDIIKIINAAGFVAVPVLAVLIGLDWYFKRDGRSRRAIFIAVAGVISAIFYSYLVWTEPSASLILTPIGWYLGLSVLAVAIYFGLYEAYHGQAVRWWILPVALVSYTGLYCAMAIFCAAVLARHDYWLLGGHVVANSQPLPAANLTLQNGNISTIRNTTSDARGRFLFALKHEELKAKQSAEKPAHLLVEAIGYGKQTLDLDGKPNVQLVFSFEKPIPH